MRFARQYILPRLAAKLREVHRKSPRDTSLFELPNESNLARMLRADAQRARDAWLSQWNRCEQARADAEKSDFLLAINAAGEQLELHALRHTCGA